MLLFKTIINTNGGETVAGLVYAHTIRASGPNDFDAFAVVDFLADFWHLVEKGIDVEKTVVESRSGHSCAVIVSREYHVRFQIVHDLQNKVTVLLVIYVLC